MLKKTIVEAHVRDALLGSSVLTPKGANAMPRMADDDTRSPEARAVAAIRPVPPTPPPAPAPVPEPAAVHPKPIRGRPSKPGVTQFTRRDNAARSGTDNTGSVDGVDFYTLPLGEGWTWKHAADVTDEEKIVWRQSRKHGPVVKQASRARMAALQPPQPQEEPTVTVVPITRKDPMPTPAPEIVAPMADPARQPTRDERQLIHDELTKHYNIVDQRYDGQDSDTNVGGRLNLPRAWVTSVREMFFGEYDRNQTSEKRKAAMSEAIALAGAATKRLLEMAAEAETIEANLVAALNKLEG